MNIDVAEQLRAMEASVVFLRTRIEKSDQHKDAEIARLTALCETRYTALEIVKRQLEELRLERAAAKDSTALEELRKCNQLQATTLRELRRDEARHNDEIVTARAALALAKKQIDEQQQKLKEAEEAVHRAKTSARLMSDQNQFQHRKIAELQADLDKALKQASDAQQRADDRGRELTELTATLVATRNEMITARTLLEEARDKAAKLEKRLIEALELAEARRVHGLEGEHTANAMLENTEELLKLARQDLVDARSKSDEQQMELVTLRDELRRTKNHLSVYQGKAKVASAVMSPVDLPPAYATIPALPCGLKMSAREAWLEKNYTEVVDILGKIRYKLKVVPTSGPLLLDLVWELWTLLGMRGN